MSVFGRIVLHTDVENAITDLLKTWMDAYLRELERITGREEGQLPRIRAWGLGDVEDRLEEQQPPALMVECAKAKMKAASDSYTAQWDTTIAVVAKSDQSMARSRELAGLYLVAACLIAIQKPLGIGEMDWTDQDHGILDVDTRRFLARGEAQFATTVPEVAQIEAGPAEPTSPSDEELPLVNTINVDLTTEP